jgi:hypothetical protein
VAVTLKSLDQVLALKRRRIDKLEAQAAEQARHIKECEQRLEEARARQREAEQVEQGVRDTIEALCTRPNGFRPSDLITLQHVLEMKVAETKAVVKQAKAAEQQLEAAREALRATRRLIDKSKQQLEQLRELRDKLARELFQAAEDVTDEEAEEAAVARMIAATAEQARMEAADAWT